VTVLHRVLTGSIGSPSPEVRELPNGELCVIFRKRHYLQAILTTLACLSLPGYFHSSRMALLVACYLAAWIEVVALYFQIGAEELRITPAGTKPTVVVTVLLGSGLTREPADRILAALGRYAPSILSGLPASQVVT
jgi:hypothetical protein